MTTIRVFIADFYWSRFINCAPCRLGMHLVLLETGGIGQSCLNLMSALASSQKTERRKTVTGQYHKP